MFFWFFQNFDIFGCYILAWGGVKGQKMVQNDKTICLSCSTFQEQYIWFSFMVFMCKTIISSGLFFSLSKFWFFRLTEVKWQKTVQNDKKFCPSCFISQEPYLVWLSFMVYICKMIISADFCFIFFKSLIFWVVRVIKRQKNCPKWQKNSVCHTSCLRNYISYDCHLWCTCVKW